MIFTKKTLVDAKEVSCQSSCSQILVIEISNIHVYLVYRSPNSKAENDTKLLELLSNIRHPCVIVGDFNIPEIDWSSTSGLTNMAADFINAIQESFLSQFIRQSTHKNGNVLDLVFSNKCNMIQNLTVDDTDVISDHSPIFFDIIKTSTYEHSQGGNFFDYSRADF